jgi:polyferredoxin
MAFRRWIQTTATLLSNGYWLFPWRRSIYQGSLKSVCVPGLNCYSCPAATGACPIGSLQHFMAGLRPGWQAGEFKLGLYVVGWLGLIGSIVGRMPCAWLCPFGLFQELMHKIPSPKFAVPRALTYLKYVFLALFVIIFPLWLVDDYGYGLTWFCRYVCPAGTLEAGLPMLALKPELRGLVGWLFYNKLAILVLFLVWMVLSRRPFCRTTCPLGAIYALFNKYSLFRMVHHPDRCTHCQACYQGCPMGIKFYEGANQTDCIRCLKCMQQSCKFDAISYEIVGLSTPPTTALKPNRVKTSSSSQYRH